MNAPIVWLTAVTMAVAGCTSLPGVVQSLDETEIRSVVVRQAETWNRNDAKAYAALFTEDCDVVNVLGWWWKGRAELEQKLTAGFSFVFRDSRLVIDDVRVRPLAPDVVVAHAHWTMTGAKPPPGIPEPREGIQSLVVTKREGRWLIRSFQNTLSLPERPFPTQPGMLPAGKP